MENARYAAVEQALRDMREALIDALSLNPRMRVATKVVFDARLQEAMEALNMEDAVPAGERRHHSLRPHGQPITEGPGTGWKLSQSARDKIMKLTQDNVHNVAALHSIVLAELSTPLGTKDR